MLNNWLSFFSKRPVTLRETSVNQLQMLILAQDDTGQKILKNKTYEDRETRFVKSVARADWIVFDVGANVGYYSLLLAKLAPQGEVHAFEPHPLARKILEVNLLLNNLENLKVNPVALAEKEGRSDFCLTKDTGFSSFREIGRVEFLKKIQVPCLTLDQYVQSQGIKKIDFIKIDVEGAEGLVLNGAKKTLDELRPPLLMIELQPENLKVYGEEPTTISARLAAFGYRLFVLNKQNRLQPASAADYYGRSANFFFYYD